jgi:hypothetical protein
MKVSTIIAAAGFGMAVYASAIPADLSERQTNPITLITNDITTLTNTVNTDLGAITTAVQNVGKGITGQLQLIAQVNVDLAAIGQAILTAAGQLTTATFGALTQLNPVDLKTLIADIQNLVTLVGQVGVTLKNGLGGLPAATKTALGAEFAVVTAALGGLLVPLQTYATAVEQALGSTGVDVTGLQAVVQSLLTTIESLPSLVNL